MVGEENIYEESKPDDLYAPESKRRVEDQFAKNLPPAFMLNLPSYDIDKLKEEIASKHRQEKDDSPEGKTFKIWLESFPHKVKLKKIYGKVSRDHRTLPGTSRV